MQEKNYKKRKNTQTKLQINHIKTNYTLGTPQIALYLHTYR